MEPICETGPRGATGRRRAGTPNRRPAHAGRRLPSEVLERLEVLRRAGVEANLQQLQPVVIVLPKEILDPGVEQTPRRPRRYDRRAAGNGHRESDRRELGGYVREALLPLRARGDIAERAQHVGGGHGQAGGWINGGDSDSPAQGRLGASKRLAERAHPNGVAAGREGEGGRPISAVLVQDPKLAWGKENLRGCLGVARPEGDEDDVAAAIHVLVLVARNLIFPSSVAPNPKNQTLGATATPSPVAPGQGKAKQHRKHSLCPSH